MLHRGSCLGHRQGQLQFELQRRFSKTCLEFSSQTHTLFNSDLASIQLPNISICVLSAHLGDHLIIGVPHEGDPLQGGSAPGQQGHVGRHAEGNLHAGAYQVL